MKKLSAIFFSFTCILSLANCSSTNEEKGQNIKDFANYETLAYSLNRIANADISFNFSMNDKNTEKKSNSKNINNQNMTTSSNYSNLNKVKEQVNLNEPQGEIMEFDIGEIQKLDDFDYFSEMESALESQRGFARAVVDNAVRHITVLDTAIILDNTLSVLSYDKTNNSVYTILKTPLETHEIKIYYDSLGKETVEMTSICKLNGVEDNEEVETTKIRYTPGSYYFIAKQYNVMINVSMANKIDGEWQGLSYYFDVNNPFLTKKGTYDYANGQIGVSFLVEKNGIFFTFSDFLEAYRNGGRINSGEKAEENDEIKLKQYLFNSSFVTFDYLNNSIDFTYNSFDGIDKAHISLDSELGPSSQTEMIHFYYDNEKDYLLLDNGNKIVTNEIWSNELNKTVFLVGGEAYLTKKENYALNPNYPIRFIIDGDTITEKLGTFKEYMKAKGFTISKFFSDSIINDLCLIEQNNETYRGKLFKYLFNRDYSEKNLINEMTSRITEFDVTKNLLNEKINAYETINFEDMPKLNSCPNLITITAETNKASVVDNNIDLSSISISVDKNILLDNSSIYGISATFDNKEITTAAFNTVAFTDSKMTFSGKVLNDFISIADEGVYNLKLCFGKVSDTGFIPLSNEIVIELNDFDEYTFRTENDEDLNGCFEVSYSYFNGQLKVTKQFINN